MRALLFAFLFVALHTSHADPSRFKLPGNPEIELDFDHAYAWTCTAIPSDKKDVQTYMFAPSDDQSSAVFSIGRDAPMETEQTIAEKFEGAKATKSDGTINKKPVVWLHWKDAHHLYSFGSLTLVDKAGMEKLVSLFLVANTAERLAALENHFAVVTFL